jgi:hypothetical protein
MRSLLALQIGAFLSVSALACGHAGPRADSGDQVASSGATEKRTQGDRRNGVDDYDDDDGYEQTIRSDGDSDDGRGPTDVDGDSDSTSRSAYDQDDSRIRDFGHAAPTAVRRQVAALVKSYYASVADNDGARACSLVYPSLARTFSQDLGEGGPHYLHGLKTCATVVSKIFADNHPQLATYGAHLMVTDVRVKGGLGIAVLGSGRLPGRQIEVIREHGVWRIFALTDKELP